MGHVHVYCTYNVFSGYLCKNVGKYISPMDFYAKCWRSFFITPLAFWLPVLRSTRRGSSTWNAQIPFLSASCALGTCETKMKRWRQQKKVPRRTLSAILKHGAWEAILFFWCPVFSALFHVGTHNCLSHEPGSQYMRPSAPKITTCNAHLRPYQVTLEKASLKLGKDWRKKTVILLMAEILHQLRLVVFPIIYRFYRLSAPSQVVSRNSAINSSQLSSWLLNLPPSWEKVRRLHL